MWPFGLWMLMHSKSHRALNQMTIFAKLKSEQMNAFYKIDVHTTGLNLLTFLVIQPTHDEIKSIDVR